MVAWLVAGLFCVYSTTSSGGFEVGDAVYRYETAKSWLAGSGGALPQETAWEATAVGPDGRVFSFYGPLQSLVMAPVILVAAPFAGAAGGPVDVLVLSAVVFPLISAVAIGLVFGALRRLGFSTRSAVLASLALGLGSLFWHYARSGQEESLVAFGFALWLFGAAGLTSGSKHPCLSMAAGGAVALAARWAAAPMLAVLAVVTLVLLWRHRRQVRPWDLGRGFLLAAAAILALAVFNVSRFGAPLETGYGLWYRHHGEAMFALEGYPEKVAALLVSPHKGLLVYSPMVALAVAGIVLARSRSWALLGYAGAGTLLVAVLFFAAFRYWGGGHAWGPRFLVAPQVLLAPGLGAVFERIPRGLAVVVLLVAPQIFSVALPASTEEHLRHLRSERGLTCSSWSWSCNPPCLRPGLALAAVAHTFNARPGMILPEGARATPREALESSDYRTLYWWPFRVAFRLAAIPLWAAIALVAAGLGGGLACLGRAWRGAAAGLRSAPPAAAGGSA